jgi:cohesin loading factor subunit SCC2
MPRTASTFASELTAKLKPMIAKPSGGYPTVKETIGCYCAVINHLTKDYKGLMNILRACHGMFW